MKVLGKNPERCTQCRACENECSRTWFKEENAEKSSIRIGDRIITCSQCGECINVCPVQAIAKDKSGVVRVNKNTCVGCFMCVGFCPESAMGMHNDYPEPFKCIACGQCVKKCSANAIYLVQEGK